MQDSKGSKGGTLDEVPSSGQRELLESPSSRKIGKGVVAHSFNLRWISEFEASLVYKVTSRTARDIQRNPVSKKQKNKKTKTKKTTPKLLHRCWAPKSNPCLHSKFS